MSESSWRLARAMIAERCPDASPEALDALTTNALRVVAEHRRAIAGSETQP